MIEAIAWIAGGIVVGMIIMIAIIGYLWNRGGKGHYF